MGETDYKAHLRRLRWIHCVDNKKQSTRQYDHPSNTRSSHTLAAVSPVKHKFSIHQLHNHGGGGLQQQLRNYFSKLCNYQIWGLRCTNQWVSFLHRWIIIYNHKKFFLSRTHIKVRPCCWLANVDWCWMAVGSVCAKINQSKHIG